MAALAAAVLLRFLLDPLMDGSLPFVTVFGAVAASIWLGGVGPALAVMGLGYLACSYLFLEPRGTLGPYNLSTLVGLVAFLFTSSLIVAIGQAMRRAHERARQHGQALQETIARMRRMEEERARDLMSARQLAAIVESSDDAIVSKTLEGVIQSWNAGAERLFGYAAAEAVGQHVFLVIPPERRAEEEEILAALRAGRRVEHFETERRRKDGRLVPVSLTISPIRDETGKVVGASKVARDVTERRQVEEERQKFVTLVENSTDFIGMCDLQAIPFFVNRAGLAMVGLDSLEQARVTPVAEFFFPEDQPRIMGEFFPSVLEKGHGALDVRFRHFKTGDAIWMEYKVLVIKDPSGQPVAIATVSQDVTERRRLTDDLRRLAADLSDADRRKNEFLAMLAHELRNPLAPLSNAVQVLRRAGLGEEKVAAAISMLERQTGHLTRLVEDLLDVSRITQGKIELRRERVELNALVALAAEAAGPLYERMKHQLSVSLAARPLHVDADPTRLAQVVGNLLTNAAKFTDHGGRVEIAVEDRGDEAAIHVRDHGIGIAPHQLPRLFDLFMQVDTSLERSRDGLGIGLTLVRSLVTMHGGRVEARSDGIGHGSEFVVHLPVVSAMAETRPAPAAPAGPRQRRLVLVVDDNEDGAESLALLLQLEGHETHVAHDGQQGVEAAERLRPDVVLLDIGLPVVNGYEACRKIRSQPWGTDMVLLAVTGWGQHEDLLRSQEAGFTGHLVKPVDAAALLKILDAAPSATLTPGMGPPGAPPAALRTSGVRLDIEKPAPG
jgi:PAS domain S-box-containing protein